MGSLLGNPFEEAFQLSGEPFWGAFLGSLSGEPFWIPFLGSLSGEPMHKLEIRLMNQIYPIVYYKLLTKHHTSARASSEV